MSTATKLIPLRKKLPAKPINTTRTPPRAGPMIVAPLKATEFNDIAFERSSRGTRKGTSANRVGWSKLRVMPLNTEITRMCQNWIKPVRVSTPRVKANKICVLCVKRRSLRLSTLSAIPPPTNAKTKKGEAYAKETTPRAAPEL